MFLFLQADQSRQLHSPEFRLPPNLQGHLPMVVIIGIIGTSLLIYHYKREFAWRSAELEEYMVQLLLLEAA